MGFWDEIVKIAHHAGTGELKLPAPVAPAMSASLVREAAGLLTGGAGPGGGLACLVQQFERQGLGHAVASWVGPGANLPISGAQLRSVLGEESLAQAAQRLGLPPAAAASTLAAVLPAVVDRLTPEGSLDSRRLEEGLSWLAGRPA